MAYPNNLLSLIISPVVEKVMLGNGLDKYFAGLDNEQAAQLHSLLLSLSGELVPIYRKRRQKGGNAQLLDQNIADVIHAQNGAVTAIIKAGLLDEKNANALVRTYSIRTIRGLIKGERGARMLREGN